LLSLIGPDKLHLMNDVEFYSIQDFIDVATGSLLECVKDLADKFLLHINQCTLCRAKGTICEFCSNSKPIYPFNIVSTIQCSKCNGLFHRKCYVKEKCPKCARKKRFS